MTSLTIAIIASIVFYIAVVALFSKHVQPQSDRHMRQALSKLAMQTNEAKQQEVDELEHQKHAMNPIVRAFAYLPGAKQFFKAANRAGMEENLHVFLIAMLVVFVLLLIQTSKMGFLGVIVSVFGTLFVGWFWVKRKFKKRNNAFMDKFPDALDMIVRSVRSGYPLNAALRMIVDNMDEPVDKEFQRVLDEASFGWTLQEALNRMAERMDEQDVSFFTVVLSVQQESGGNLSEVLSNLSTLIRKRRQLKLKIKALSSEGRATAWILGSLPVLLFIFLYIMSPAHIAPLLYTTAGNMVLAAVVGLITMGMVIVRMMINIDI